MQRANLIRPIELILAFIEVVGGLYCLWLLLGSVQTIVSPSVQYSDAAAWSVFGLLFAVPLGAVLFIAGITMYKRSKRRWLYQLPPLAVVACSAAILLL